MRDLTKSLWDKHNRHPGGRVRLFGAISGGLGVGVAKVLYTGPYIDIAALFVFDDVMHRLRGLHE